jgi:hypothetical protein
MSEDIMQFIESNVEAFDDSRLFQAFLSRISAWQEFMRKGGDGLLSCEAEVGLFGELSILHELVSTGVPMQLAVDSWQGPFDATHDFKFALGALEVKSTRSTNGFPVTVSSLEQLDDFLTQPIFLVGVKLAQSSMGVRLPELVSSIRDNLVNDVNAMTAFDIRLLSAGFFDGLSEMYATRFVRLDFKVWSVSGTFPRLTRTSVSREILNARYEIDLDSIGSESILLSGALEGMGVLS